MSCKECEEKRKAAEEKEKSIKFASLHAKDIRVYIALVAIAVAYMLLIDLVS